MTAAGKVAILCCMRFIEAEISEIIFLSFLFPIDPDINTTFIPEFDK